MPVPNSTITSYNMLRRVVAANSFSFLNIFPMESLYSVCDGDTINRNVSYRKEREPTERKFKIYQFAFFF